MLARVGVAWFASRLNVWRTSSTLSSIVQRTVISAKHVDLFQHCCTVADFMSLGKPNARGAFLRDSFASWKDILSV